MMLIFIILPSTSNIAILLNLFTHDYCIIMCLLITDNWLSSYNWQPYDILHVCMYI